MFYIEGFILRTFYVSIAVNVSLNISSEIFKITFYNSFNEGEETCEEDSARHRQYCPKLLFSHLINKLIPKDISISCRCKNIINLFILVH